MDGIHDLGGKHGHGKVTPGPAEPAFPEHWQGAVFTIINTLMRQGIAHNVDHFRHAVERIDPVSYLQDGYYGRWLGAAEIMLVEAGQLATEEITARAIAAGAGAGDRIAARPAAKPDDFSQVDADASAEDAATAQRQAAQAPEFRLGQRVRTRATGVAGHTRLPAYARAAVGEIVACHGAWVYPDTNAHGRGEQPQYLYTVAFAGDTLWGDAGDAGTEVCIDLFEPYLREVD